MTDQEVKAGADQVSNAIMEVKTFVDKRGFEVRELKKVYETFNMGWIVSTDENANEYFGSIILNIETGNPQRPVVQHPVQFKFPPTVKCINNAYDTFEEELEKEISRQKEEAEKQRMAAMTKKEIIMPGMMKFPQPKD